VGLFHVNGTVAAIGIRLASIWFATLLGLLAMRVLELAQSAGGRHATPAQGLIENV